MQHTKGVSDVHISTQGCKLLDKQWVVGGLACMEAQVLQQAGLRMQYGGRGMSGECACICDIVQAQWGAVRGLSSGVEGGRPNMEGLGGWCQLLDKQWVGGGLPRMTVQVLQQAGLRI